MLTDVRHQLVSLLLNCLVTLLKCNIMKSQVHAADLKQSEHCNVASEKTQAT